MVRGAGGGGFDLVEVLLEAGEQGADLGGVAQVIDGVGEGFVFELQEWGEFFGGEFVDAFLDVLGEDEGEKGLLFGGEFLVDERGGAACAVLASFGRDGVGDMGEDIE